MHIARFLSLKTKIFFAGDENSLCAGSTYQRFLSLTTIFHIEHARNVFSSLTTKVKISVAKDKNRAVCARLKKPVDWLQTQTGTYLVHAEDIQRARELSCAQRPMKRAEFEKYT